MKTRILVVFIAFILAPCISRSDSWSVGQMEKSGIGSYKKLLAEFDGWRIWETSGQGSITCVAVKAAKGKPWPEVSDGFGIVTGGAGFYMHIDALLKSPYFGFYGRQVYRRSSIAEVDGEIIHWTDDKDTVLSWEGKTVFFEVSSGPYKNLYIDVSNDAGEIDFSGIRLAFDKMMSCIQNHNP